MNQRFSLGKSDLVALSEIEQLETDSPRGRSPQLLQSDYADLLFYCASTFENLRYGLKSCEKRDLKKFAAEFPNPHIATPSERRVYFVALQEKLVLETSRSKHHPESDQDGGQDDSHSHRRPKTKM